MQALARLVPALFVVPAFLFMSSGCGGGGGGSEPHCEGVEPAYETQQECVLAGGEWVVPTPASSAGGGDSSICGQFDQLLEGCGLANDFCHEEPSEGAGTFYNCFLDCAEDATCDQIEQAMSVAEGPLMDCAELCEKEAGGGVDTARNGAAPQ